MAEPADFLTEEQKPPFWICSQNSLIFFSEFALTLEHSYSEHSFYNKTVVVRQGVKQLYMHNYSVSKYGYFLSFQSLSDLNWLTKLFCLSDRVYIYAFLVLDGL